MNKIGVGVIGASPASPGWAVLAHVPAIQALPDYQLVAVSTSRHETAQAIAARVCISESLYQIDDFDFPPGFAATVRSIGPAERSRDDISYARPLQVTRAFQGQQNSMS